MVAPQPHRQAIFDDKSLKRVSSAPGIDSGIRDTFSPARAGRAHTAIRKRIGKILIRQV